MWTVGAEAVAGWLVTAANPADAPPGGSQAMLQIRIPNWEPAKIGAWNETEKAAIQALSNLVDAREDWSAFLKKNGKFLMYATGCDYQVNGPVAAMRFYDRAAKKNDRTAFDRNTRFYVAPNGGHGGWGISATTGERIPYHTDFIAALTDWVEKGITPPDALMQTLQEMTPPYASSVSRPLCRYPMYPRYSGSGDPKKMESWRCAAPAPGPDPAAESASTSSSR
jgi:feruloyl esterase